MKPEKSEDVNSIKVCMVGVFNYLTDARVKGYAEALAAAGDLVDVIGIQSHSQEESYQDFIIERGVRIFTIRVDRSRNSSFAYLLEYGFAFIFLCFRLTEKFLKNRYDVIHFHNMPDFLVFAGLIAKLLGARIILDIHDLMPEVYMSKFPDAKNGWGVWFMRLEEKISIQFSNAVIVANAHFRSNLIKRGISSPKITVVKNFPDPHIFNYSRYAMQSGKPLEWFTLIFPGTIAPRYGLEVAIKALPLIKGTIPNIRLLIIGRPGEYGKSLAALAEKLDVSSSVEFRAVMPNNEIPEQLLRADIGIYPALPDAHMSIAIPGKLLEFAAMRIPILSSRLQIVEEMFDESAVLFFEPGNVDGFAECVLKLYENPTLREELVRNATQTFVQRHSGEHEIQAYWDVLRRLLPGKKLSPEINRGDLPAA